MRPTYLVYLAATVIVPLVVVGALAWYRGGLRTRADAFGVGVLMAIAFSYTVAWDGYLIQRGVWWYGDGVVTARFWVVPLGELSFFLAQTALTGLWLHVLDPLPAPERPRTDLSWGVGLLVVAAVELVGMVLVFSDAGFYLGFVLVWCTPVLGFLWFLGGPVLWRARRVVAAAILVPTSYLWVVDRVAIGMGLWTISDGHSTGLAVLGLPVEEMVFFLATNTLVVFGLFLYRWVVVRSASRGVVGGLLGLLPRNDGGESRVAGE